MKIFVLLMMCFVAGLSACNGCRQPGGSGLANRAPTIRSAFIEDDNLYYAASTIPTSAQGVTDAENDPVELTYQWYVNEAPVEGAVATFLERGIAGKGDVVKCEVTPRDAFHAGKPVFSNAVTVSNTPPNLPAATLSPDPVTFVGRNLTVTIDPVDDDDDGDALVYRYRWLRNNVDMGYGQTADAITFTGRTGDVWQVWVSAWDGEAGSAELLLTTYVDRMEMASPNFILVGQAHSGIAASASSGSNLLVTSAGSDGAAMSAPPSESPNYRFESSFNE